MLTAPHMSKLQVVLALSMAACGFELQPPNDPDAVNLGLIVDYGARRELTEPIAAGVKMPLGVQNGVKSSLLSDYDYVDGTLTVEDSDGAAVAPVQTSPGRFEMVFPRAGRYSVTAKTERGQLSMAMTAKDVGSLRVLKARVSTTAGGSSCSKPVGAEPLTLATNQRLDVTVGAFSPEGESMLGVLDLDVLDLTVDVSKPVLFPTANSFIVTPRGSGAGSVTFTDKSSGASVKLDVAHDGSTASCP